MEDFRSGAGSVVGGKDDEYRNAAAEVHDDESPDFKIRPLDPSSIPHDATIVITGKRHTGKSVLMTDLMYYMRNKVDLVVGICPTERGSGTLRKIAPRMFTYTKFDIGIIQRILDTQDAVMDNGREPMKIMLVLDDCMSDKSLLKKAQVRELFMNGRHLKLGIILTAQYMMDLPTAIRTNIDFVFSFREPSVGNRERLYRNFFGVFNKAHEFEIVFRACTEGYKCICLDNRKKTMKPEDCVYYFQAEMRQPFRTGRSRFWRLSHAMELQRPRNVRSMEELTSAPILGGTNAKGKKKASVTLQ